MTFDLAMVTIAFSARYSWWWRGGWCNLLKIL